MSGPFLINNDETSESRKSIPPASRHPGKCGKEKLNDPELVFIKYHPQMEKQVGNLVQIALFPTVSWLMLRRLLVRYF